MFELCVEFRLEKRLPILPFYRTFWVVWIVEEGEDGGNLKENPLSHDIG
jgi:hypothetical protein